MTHGILREMFGKNCQFLAAWPKTRTIMFRNCIDRVSKAPATWKKRYLRLTPCQDIHQAGMAKRRKSVVYHSKHLFILFVSAFSTFEEKSSVSIRRTYAAVFFRLHANRLRTVWRCDGFSSGQKVRSMQAREIRANVIEYVVTCFRERGANRAFYWIWILFDVPPRTCQAPAKW